MKTVEKRVRCGTIRRAWIASRLAAIGGSIADICNLMVEEADAHEQKLIDEIRAVGEFLTGAAELVLRDREGAFAPPSAAEVADVLVLPIAAANKD